MNRGEDQDAKSRSTMTRLEWGVVFSMLASASSIIFSAGVVWSKLQNQETQIKDLQIADHDQVDRLARIETKLDLILEEKRQARR